MQRLPVSIAALIMSLAVGCSHDFKNGVVPQGFKPGSGAGRSLSGTTGPRSYDVAAYSICGGYAVYHTDATITWGDGNTWTGWVAGGPSAGLIGENNFTTPEVSTMCIRPLPRLA